MINPFEQQPPDWLQNLTQVLADPRMQSAVFSGAAQLAQPLPFGQSQFGHLMSSLGQAGAGARNADTMALREREAGSKADLREAQASAAEARAGQMGARADLSAERLGLVSKALDQKKDLFNIGEQRRWLSDHAKEVDRVRAHNSKIDANMPFMSKEEKAKAVKLPEPTLQNTLKNAPASVKAMFEQGSAAPSASSPSSSSVVTVQTPAEAEALPLGTRYKTPEGREFVR